MGNCALEIIANENAVDSQINKDLNLQLKSDKKNLSGQRKLLFLGPGDSGKSTVYKQLVSLFGKGYKEHDRRAFSKNIHQNIMQATLTLIKQSRARSEKSDEFSMSDDIDEHIAILDECSNDTRVDKEMVEHIKAIWGDSGIQATHSERNSYQFPFQAEYFLGERIDEVCDPEYVPTFEDLIFMRNRTTGILEETLNVHGDTIHVVDVGGQRSERRKWIHCFENVTAVIYVAAISEYDQLLFEDERTNRMVESLLLFEEICNNRYFFETPVIVFLNKNDIFMEKISHSEFKQCPVLEDWNGKDPPGKDSYEEATRFIRDKFIAKNRNQERGIYTHITHATNQDNINNVFIDVRDIVARAALRDGGIL